MRISWGYGGIYGSPCSEFCSQGLLRQCASPGIVVFTSIPPIIVESLTSTGLRVMQPTWKQLNQYLEEHDNLVRVKVGFRWGLLKQKQSVCNYCGQLSKELTAVKRNNSQSNVLYLHGLNRREERQGRNVFYLHGLKRRGGEAGEKFHC